MSYWSVAAGAGAVVGAAGRANPRVGAGADGVARSAMPDGGAAPPAGGSAARGGAIGAGAGAATGGGGGWAAMGGGADGSGAGAGIATGGGGGAAATGGGGGAVATGGGTAGDVSLLRGIPVRERSDGLPSAGGGVAAGAGAGDDGAGAGGVAFGAGAVAVRPGVATGAERGAPTLSPSWAPNNTNKTIGTTASSVKAIRAKALARPGMAPVTNQANR